MLICHQFVHKQLFCFDVTTEFGSGTQYILESYWKKESTLLKEIVDRPSALKMGQDGVFVPPPSVAAF